MATGCVPLPLALELEAAEPPLPPLAPPAVVSMLLASTPSATPLYLHHLPCALAVHADPLPGACCLDRALCDPRPRRATSWNWPPTSSG